jgi:hypothetical protein
VKNELKLEHDLHDIFFFGNKTLYYKSVEILLMLNCLYLAFISTSYFSIASSSSYPELWKLLMYVYYIEWLKMYYIISYSRFLPLFITFPCLGGIVSRSAKILAISELNFHIIGDLICKYIHTYSIL